MYYYKLAIIGSSQEPLTYAYSKSLDKNRLVYVELKSREKSAFILSQVDKPSFKTKEILEVSSLYIDDVYFKTAKFISDYYFCSLAEAVALFVPLDKELTCKDKIFHIQDTITLSKPQTDALEFIQKHKLSLIFADTGSGKTEIYMSYFSALTCKGKRALLLLPEISLTPQMQIRFEHYFADSFVLWHSKMTKKQKQRALQKILSGEAMIVAGPRSALFLPIKNLAVIVVDEEHDESYKSSSSPRYNARDVAIYMGNLLNIPVVLGSATPSLSSYVKFPFFRLKGGYHECKREFIYEHSREEISELIQNAIEINRDNNRQAIMFIPTRANFKYIICDNCGYTIECPFCSVGMSLHVKSNALKCHYCNYMEPRPQICPKCTSGMLENSRLGTAEAIEYFNKNYAELKTLQFDRDTISTQNRLKKALKAFNDGDIDMLIGTQMLSKGHDYEDVTLAIVMGLDNMLQIPDYRSREKSLALLIQIAGRSGRRHDAKVIVQSFNEYFFAKYVENFDLFLEDEKRVRKDLYPPYKKLARILFAHKNRDKAQEAMYEMTDKIRSLAEVEIVGFGASAIERIAGKYRFQILLRSDKSTTLLRVIKATKNSLAQIDMDPVEFS